MGSKATGGARLDRLRTLADRMRQILLEMIHHAGSGHVGSSLSCVDIISVLKFDQMDWRGDVPRTESDVFVLSKGHAVPAWYAALVVSGDLAADEARTLRTVDSRLQGHPDRVRCELVDVSTGALGQGLSIAVGRAHAKRLKGQDNYVYCVAGDGEVQEGQVWEALMYAGVRGAANLILFIDHNKSQNDGVLDEILPLHPLIDKFEAFRWHVQEIDGHSHEEIRDAVLRAKQVTGKPSVVIANTRKGHLGHDRVLLGGAHSGTLTETDLHEAIDYLRTAS